FAGINRPLQVGYFAFAGAHRPGNAEAGGVDRHTFPVNEILENLPNSTVVLSFIKPLHHALQLVALVLIGRQKHARGADVACEYHSITLHSRPSRCNNSSDIGATRVLLAA